MLLRVNLFSFKMNFNGKMFSYGYLNQPVNAIPDKGYELKQVFFSK